jgi:gamma-glutamylcyclotransferase
LVQSIGIAPFLDSPSCVLTRILVSEAFDFPHSPSDLSQLGHAYSLLLILNFQHSHNGKNMADLSVPSPRDLTPLGLRSRTPSPNRDGRTLLFAYGSSLWRHQVTKRCPGAQYIGIARLRNWRWQINERGYANVVETPPVVSSPTTTKWLGPLMGGEEKGRETNDRVYGIVYRLDKEDEEKLDGYEDVPNSYEKETMWVEFWGKREGADGSGHPVDVKNMRSQRVKVLVYVDKKHTTSSSPNGMYRYKMNVGIRDALAGGIPQSYIDQCIRPFVPLGQGKGVVIQAIEDAVRMGIDVKSIVEKVEDGLAEKGVKEECGEGQAGSGPIGNHLESVLKGKGDEMEVVVGGGGGGHRGRALGALF